MPCSEERDERHARQRDADAVARLDVEVVDDLRPRRASARSRGRRGATGRSPACRSTPRLEMLDLQVLHQADRVPGPDQPRAELDVLDARFSRTARRSRPLHRRPRAARRRSRPRRWTPRSRAVWWTKWCSRLRYWETKPASPGASSYEPITAVSIGMRAEEARDSRGEVWRTPRRRRRRRAGCRASRRPGTLRCGRAAGPPRCSSTITVAPIGAAVAASASLAPSTTTMISPGRGSSARQARRPSAPTLPQHRHWHDHRDVRGRGRRRDELAPSITVSLRRVDPPGRGSGVGERQPASPL